MAEGPDLYFHDLKQTLSLMNLLQNFINGTGVITSGMIIRYLKTKPPGAKTILDMIAIDTFYSQIGTLTVWGCIANLGHFNGQANYQLAEMFIASAVFVLAIMIANVQSYITINAVLIFKPELIIDVTDDTVMKCNRAFVLTYTLISKLLDALTPQNPIFLDYMTGKDESSILATGLGTYLQLVILLISLIVFQIYKPTELVKKGRLFLKLIGCVIGLLFFISSGVSLNDSLSVDLEDSKDFLLLTAYIGIIVILGWILPGVFISSYQSLKRYFNKLIAVTLNYLIALSTVIVYVKKNRVDNFEP